jgi:hypothetical protein
VLLLADCLGPLLLLGGRPLLLLLLLPLYPTILLLPLRWTFGGRVLRWLL